MKKTATGIGLEVGDNSPRRSRFPWWLLAALLGPLLASADLPKGSPHDFAGRCDECHLSLSGPRPIFVRDIDRLCDGCHGSLGLSHPSGMKPATPLPAGFPLDWNGRMTCATCHDVHGKGESLLRSDRRGRRFCFLCHNALPGIHGDAVRSAHTGSRTNAAVFEPRRFPGSIDEGSLMCLSCHDESLASVPVRGGNTGVYTHGGSSHPIGVEYRRSYRRGRYVPLSMLDPSLVLFDGKIGCGTCHNVYSKEKYALAVSNHRSALCLRCHVK